MLLGPIQKVSRRRPQRLAYLLQGLLRDISIKAVCRATPVLTSWLLAHYVYNPLVHATLGRLQQVAGLLVHREDNPFFLSPLPALLELPIGGLQIRVAGLDHINDPLRLRWFLREP